MKISYQLAVLFLTIIIAATPAYSQSIADEAYNAITNTFNSFQSSEPAITPTYGYEYEGAAQDYYYFENYDTSAAYGVSSGYYDPTYYDPGYYDATNNYDTNYDATNNYDTNYYDTTGYYDPTYYDGSSASGDYGVSYSEIQTFHSFSVDGNIFSWALDVYDTVSAPAPLEPLSFSLDESMNSLNDYLGTEYTSNEVNYYDFSFGTEIPQYGARDPTIDPSTNLAELATDVTYSNWLSSAPEIGTPDYMPIDDLTTDVTYSNWLSSAPEIGSTVSDLQSIAYSNEENQILSSTNLPWFESPAIMKDYMPLTTEETASLVGGSTSRSIEALIRQMARGGGLVDEDRGNDGRFRANPYGNSVDGMAMDTTSERSILEKLNEIYSYQAAHGGFNGFYQFYSSSLDPLVNGADSPRLTAQAAWVSLGVADYEARTGDTKFSEMKSGINDWLLARSTNPDGGLSMGTGTYNGDDGYGRTIGPLQYSQVYATEHNIDAYAALSRSTRQEDQAAAATLRDYILNRYDPATGMFDGGYNTNDRPLDAQTWSAMAIVPRLSDQEKEMYLPNFNTAIDNVLSRYVIEGNYNGQAVVGVNSGNGDVKGVWPEGTYGLVGALNVLADANKASDPTRAAYYTEKANLFMSEMEKLIDPNTGAHIYDTSGVWNNGVPFSHMSGTAWSVLAKQGKNPFYEEE
jgi:hypothetical protein